MKDFFPNTLQKNYNNKKIKKISIEINGKVYLVDNNKSILEIVKENQIDIPHLCFHPDAETEHHCGMCYIKIVGEDNLKRACNTVAKDGMEIITESDDIAAIRRRNLNKILEKHSLECDDCVWFQHCKLLDLVRQFGAKPIAKINKANKVIEVGKIVFDQNKCIGCEHCVNVCPVNFLELNESGRAQPSDNKTKDCTNCGQCILHCPVGAIEGVGEFEELDRVFSDKNKVAIVQFAPSIRTSIGEEFGMETGEIATGQLVSALRKVGFDFVFDTAAGADFTTMEESDELIERIEQQKNLPAMSSCCPAWVKFLEFNYPEYLNNLCTSRSPQAMLGGIIKNYWSDIKQIDPKNIFMVSVMPCVAKKYEIKRKELKIDGIPPVDMVLTTRELVRLIKKNKIDLKNITKSDADNPFGQPSGAGVIYGSSGGVFESALRTACYKMTGKNLSAESVREIRGIEGIKTKEIKIGNKIIKVCVVSGLKNAKKILDQIKESSNLYDAIEVMACPGGCIAGGGQSMPTNKKVVRKRSESLYKIDQNCQIKCAHENKSIEKAYQEFFTDENIRKKILHTHFSKRDKSDLEELINSKETHE